MAVDYTILALLKSDLVIRRVFEGVVKKRSVRLGELVKQVEPDVKKEETQKILDRLKEERLIKEKGSAVDEFKTYYVTAEGLEASRKAGI